MGKFLKVPLNSNLKFILVQPQNSKKYITYIQTEYYYLRALGGNPRKDIADIKKDFPSLAADIHIPEAFPEDQFYSSVFRMASAGVQLWTHYDVSTFGIVNLICRTTISIG